MIDLSLASINSFSQYPVSKTDEGSYVFQTSKGIHYDISFEEDRAIGGCPTCQLILTKVEHIRSGYDPNVEPSILAIINEFFRSYLNVLLYICDTSDGRESNRYRLFLKWFEKHAEPNRFTIRTGKINIEEHELYITVIFENRNPLQSDIIAQIEKDEELLSQKP